MKDNFPCKCGHFKSQHGFMINDPVCGDCMNNVKKNIKLGMIFAHEYKPDNLKYLEEKYERTL